MYISGSEANNFDALFILDEFIYYCDLFYLEMKEN